MQEQTGTNVATDVEKIQELAQLYRLSEEDLARFASMKNVNVDNPIIKYL